ncbi:MAG: type IV pilus secretin PilQ [bacterium]|nr:type IV pilus secretin PilQ [bacterium]
MGITFSGRAVCFALGLGIVLFLTQAELSAREAATITAVDVRQDEGVTRIVLRGAGDAIYTAFMREDPPRLIIELPNMSFDGVDAPINVNNGLVNDVTLGTFGDAQLGHSMARVSIGLTHASEYEVIPAGDEIVVEFKTGSGPDTSVAKVEPKVVPAAPEAALADELPAAPAPVLATTPEVVEPAETNEPDVVAPEVVRPGVKENEIVPAAPAAMGESETSKLLKVMIAESGLEISADGPFEKVDSFTLDDPDRLVIDFWGAESGVWPDRQSFESGAVARVRVGEHPGKVRVVLDLRGKLNGHEVTPVADGMMVTLDAEVPAPAAAELPAAPSQEIGEQMQPSDEPVVEEAEAEQTREPVVEPVAEVEEVAEPVEELVAAASGSETTPAPKQTLEPVVEMPDGAAMVDDSPAVDESSGPQEITSVHFESLPGLDRVVVSMNTEGTPKVVEPDAATLIVMLPGAVIQQENERRVDTTEFGGPVKMFSVFKTPDISNDEVRVVLHRSANESATIDWEDGQLYIEMERDESASMPPAMPDEQQNAADPAMPLTASAVPAAAMPSSAPVAPAMPTPPIQKTQAMELDPFLDGPANPAAIDILEEGGFDEEKGYEGRRISLDFKDADIANILRLIAEVSDLNVIAGEEVSGRVTIRLVDVPWDQALDVILLTKGLGFVRIGNILRIAPVETLKLERQARLQERRAREKLEDLVVKLQPVNYAKAKNVGKLVKRLLSSRGSVNVDKRTNTLIIKDIPSVIHEATALVKALDTQTPQVMIETKIVEASLNFSRGLGATWGSAYDAPSGLQPTGVTGGTLPGQTAQQNHFLSDNPVAAATGLLTLGVLTARDHLQLDLQLRAAERNAKGKVISSPRVVTLDNKEATIKQGVAIKFVESTSDKTTISFIDAVLQLRVTPHITANRSIIMKIKVSRNAPSLSGDGGTIVGIEKNETNTEAIVRDGETMVLGGIYVVDNGRGQTKVPFLGDIPLLGAAFRSFSIQDERRELLVFVTPRVIHASDSDL